jgi:hypothetical protein
VQQRAGQCHVQRTLGDRQQAELLGDDLALLGDLDASVHRAGRQRTERAIDGRTAAAADTAAAPVKQDELDARIREQPGERLLCLIQSP